MLLTDIYLTDVTADEIAEEFSRYISPSLLRYWSEILREASQLKDRKTTKLLDDFIKSVD